MGNVCPNNCQYNCCDQDYYCVNNYNNCNYFYYNYTWVYWTTSVFVSFVIIFLIICLCRRRRATLISQPVIVDNTQVMPSVPEQMYNPNQYYNGQNYAANQQYNLYNPNYQNNPNYQHNPNYPNNPNFPNFPPVNPGQHSNQQGYEMGEPVFLSNDHPQQQANRA